MKLKDKKNILNMTFDNMNMSQERSEEIIKELINYNTALENMEEKEDMKEKKVAVGENLHEISPKNNKNSKWQYVFGGLCVLAVAAVGIIVWNNAGINDIGNKHAAGSAVLEEQTTDKAPSADNDTSSADNVTSGDAVFYVETGEDEKLSSVIIPSPSSKDLIYEIEHGNIKMQLAVGYNYDIYSRETESGLEMFAVGVRKEGDTYTYVYSKQIKTMDNNAAAETGMALEDATAQTVKTPYNSADIPTFPEFIGVSFTENEKYIGRREEMIDKLSSFYNTVNEFIKGMKPEVSYKQEGIEGELLKGEFEYDILQKVEKAYVTCEMKDPINSRFEGYFMYLDDEIGQ